MLNEGVLFNQQSAFDIQHFQPPPRGVGPSFSHLCAVLFSFSSIAPSIVTMFLDSGLAKSSSRPPAARDYIPTRGRTRTMRPDGSRKRIASRAIATTTRDPTESPTPTTAPSRIARQRF